MGLQDVTKTDLYNKILDRRSFVTGVGVAGIGAAALGLAGCSSTAMKAMAQSSGSSDTAQNIFTAASANDPVQAFYFPTGTFDSLTNFFPVLIALETAFVAAYMTAVQEFSLMIGGGGSLFGILVERDRYGVYPHPACDIRESFRCDSWR